MRVRSLGQEDLLEEGMATHSCLENPTDRGAWWATVPRSCKELDTTEVTQQHLFIQLCQVLAAACGIQCPDQGPNPGPCIGNVESKLLDHQGSPCFSLLSLPSFQRNFRLLKAEFEGNKQEVWLLFNHSCSPQMVFHPISFVVLQYSNILQTQQL